MSVARVLQGGQQKLLQNQRGIGRLLSDGFSFCAFCVSTVQLQDFEAERFLPKKSFAAWHFSSNPPMCLGHADLHRHPVASEAAHISLLCSIYTSISSIS